MAPNMPIIDTLFGFSLKRSVK